jgi:DnaJ-class molecular chaperone
MTQMDRQFNGQMIENLCKMSDEILRGFGIPPERAKVKCDGCGGSGLVPANSGSDVSDFKCGECNGKGVRP